MTRISATAYAKHRKQNGLPGGTQPAVTKAIDAGRLSFPAVEKDKKNGHWLIDPVQADIQWEQNTISHYRYMPNLREPPEPASPPEPSDPVDPVLPSLGKNGSATKNTYMTKAEADRRASIIKTQRLYLALKKEEEEVGLISDMKTEAARVAIQVRDAMLNLVDRLPPVLAPITDATKIGEVLLQEIEDALRSMS